MPGLSRNRENKANFRRGETMSIRSFEAGILAELREVVGKRNIRQKDIMEWKTSKIEPHEGERVVFLEDNGVFVAYKE